MAELLIKIGDRSSDLWRDGDIIHAWNDAAIAAMWVQAEINEPEWCVGQDRRRAPLSNTMLRQFLSVTVSDFDQAIAELLVQKDTNEKDEIVRVRRHTFNRRRFASDVGISDDVIEDPSEVVDSRDVTVDRSVYVTEKPSLG